MKSHASGSSSVQLRRSRWLGAALILILFSAAFTALHLRAGISTTAQAQALPTLGLLLIVNSTGDQDDALSPSSGGCDVDLGTPGEQCTLRAAIEVANLFPQSTVRISIPTSDSNCDIPTGRCFIGLTRPLPPLSASMQVNGPGANLLIVLRDSAVGFSMFEVTTTGTVGFADISITGGHPSLGTGGGINNSGSGTVNVTNCAVFENVAAVGGGIYNRMGTVSVTNTTITSNVAAVGGGIYNSGTANVTDSSISSNSGGEGAGIYDLGPGTLTVTHSTIRLNSASDDGAGIRSYGVYVATVSVIDSIVNDNTVAVGAGPNVGGGVLNRGILIVRNSTINGNSASSGAGIQNEHSPDFESTASITNSTISHNRGLALAGIANEATLSVTNSTISDNDGLFAGGIGNTGTANVSNCTITHNNASSAGGISSFSTGGILNGRTGVVNIKSTIIALNTSVINGVDVNGSFASQGFNLIGDVNGSTGFTTSTDLTGLNPALDPNGLQDNGGPTKTIALLANSPAIDKGTSNSLIGPLTTDQRGTGFVRTSDDPAITNAADGTDIGAFEFQSSAAPTPTPTATPTPTPTPNGSCPLGQGYWKNNPTAWRVGFLTIGGTLYTQAQLLTILNTPVGTGKSADASLILADQLIAALLNIANGSDPTPIAATIAHAQTLLTGCIIGCGVKPSSMLGQQMTVDAILLEQYNNRLLTTGCGP
jgi:hypothetical protein